MSRAEKYVRAGLDFFFTVAIGVLLLAWLLRSISKSTEKERLAESDNGLVESAMNIMVPVSDAQVTEFIERETVNTTEAVSEMLDAESEELQQLEVEKTEAYCVKCREKREMQDPHKVITKKGRHALEGTCPVCDTKLFRFVGR